MDNDASLPLQDPGEAFTPMGMKRSKAQTVGNRERSQAAARAITSGMTATREAVEHVAREHLPGAIADTWITLLRPAARLVQANLGDPVVGQLGGLPELHEAAVWPHWSEHGPLTFVASLNCGQLASMGLDIPLPREGTLAFFYFDGQVDGGRSIVFYEDPESSEGSRVLYIPPHAAVVPRPCPPGIKPYPRINLTAQPVATYPNMQHRALIEAFQRPGDDPRSFQDHPVNDDSFMEELWELETGPAHQVGGYAYPVQGPIEDEVAQLTLGGKIAWTDPALEREARTWTLLAAIDSDERTRMMWGDAGMLYWMVRPRDLETGDFDAASFTWQCH